MKTKNHISHKPFQEFAMNRLLRFGSVALLACVLVLGSVVASSQTIQRLISYQGLLTQPSGDPIVDGSYGLVLRFYDAPSGGNLVYEEQQQTTVTKGLFNVLIGSDVALAGVDFEQQLWLETAIVGQTPFTPRTRLAVVPYAIRAENATVADSLGDDASGFVRSLNGGQGDLTVKGENGITVTRDGDTIRIEGTMTGGGSITEITSQDGTIDVTNPNGPTTDVGLADGAVTEDKIGDGAVTNVKLGDNSVTTTKIQNGSVTLEDLEPGLIPTTLPPSGPAGGDLTGEYPDPLIAPNAVTSNKILDGQVKTQDLDDGSVTTSKIADGAVTTPKLGNASVTNQKLADNSVSTSKLIDENVTTPKLSKTGVEPGVYGSSLLVPRLEVDDRGRLTRVEQVPIPDIPFTGPAGGDLTGTFPNPQIKPGVVDNSKLADDAVDGRVLQDNSVTSEKIVNGTIKLEDIASGVIPTTLPPSGPAGGVLSGTYPDPAINNAEGQQLLGAINNSATGTINDDLLNTSGVVAGTYGDGPNGLVPRFGVDQYGRVTSVVEQQILSATPTGNAGGDLQGTYPDPLINPTAGAGDRIVTGVRNSYLGGNTDINTPNNLVVLDAANRLPAADGSLITNLDAGAITQGVLPIERGGTNSSTSLNNNRIMISSGGQIVESAPIDAEMLLIGTGTSTLPTPGTITAGDGIDVSFVAPNFVISNTNPKLLPGTDDDQTLRWDGTFSQWVPNDMLLASAAGNVHAKGNVEIDGTLDVYGSTSVGIKDNTINRMGSGLNSTNSIGRDGATNYIYGETFINDNTDDNTSVGNLSSQFSSTTINVGSDGNLQLNGIDDDVMFRFLGLNNQNNVRGTLASGIALEGIMWQNGAFRLGGTDGTINPLLQDRYVNVDNNSLFFTRLGGASNMVQIDGGSNTFTVEATTNINTVGTTLTTIGNPGSRTTIGGQLDPRGDITNDVGNVVIRDQTEIIGPTFINSGTDFNTVIGQQAGTADQSISLSVGTGPNGYLFAHNIKEDPTPLYMMTEDAFERVRKKLLADMADEGIQYQDGAFRLGTGESTPDYLKEKSYDENRYVNLDEFHINYTNGSEGVDGTTFVQFDGDNGGNTLVTVTSRTDINMTGSGATNIGNASSTTTVQGPTFVNAIGDDATQLGNGIGANGNVGIGEPAIGSHLVTINGTPQQVALATPNVRIDHLGGNEYDQVYVDNNLNGVITGDGNGDLIKWDENAFLNPFAWRIIGNTHPVVDGTNNLMGLTNSAENIHFVTGGNATTNYALTIGADRRLGIGTEGATANDYQVDIENASATNGLNVNVDNFGVGVNVDAADAGVIIGVNTTPIVGTQIDASGVAVLIGSGANPPPAVGVSMDGAATGLLIESAINAIDAEGNVFINNNYNGDVSINTNGAFGNVDIRRFGGNGDVNIMGNGAVGNVRIMTSGSNGDVQIADGLGTGSHVGIGQSPTANYLLSVNGTAQTINSSAPNVQIEHLGGDALTTAYTEPDATNGFVMADQFGDLRKWDEETVLEEFAWLLGGNSDPNSNIFGTLTAQDVVMQANGSNRITLSQNPVAGADAAVEIENAAGNDSPTLWVSQSAGVNAAYTTVISAPNGLQRALGITNGLPGATVPNLTLYGDGDLFFGPGGAAPDVALHRTALNTLSISSDRATGAATLRVENGATPSFLASATNVTSTAPQVTVDPDPNNDGAFLVTGVSGDDNIQFGSLQGVYAADSYGARLNDGIVVADGSGNLRKVALPGSVFYGRLGAPTAAGTGVQRTIATVAASAPGVYEVEVLAMYSGANPLESFDATITGAASGSWGVTSSGQALEPSNVDAPAGIVAGIGVGSVPANRLTVVLKGIIDVAAPGNIDFDSLNDIGIIFQANTYIKLTRLN